MVKSRYYRIWKSFSNHLNNTQGEIISPLLANIALHGINLKFGGFSKYGNYLTHSLRRGKNKGISLIRYADDLL
ncbi:MAG: hypothetical protein K9W44_03185 [Candidatus Lokiarchaeota archaeon]|nr:hypothetical protein [Candidatus Harpocratesius repetitus]